MLCFKVALRFKFRTVSRCRWRRCCRRLASICAARLDYSSALARWPTCRFTFTSKATSTPPTRTLFYGDCAAVHDGMADNQHQTSTAGPTNCYSEKWRHQRCRVIFLRSRDTSRGEVVNFVNSSVEYYSCFRRYILCKNPPRNTEVIHFVSPICSWIADPDLESEAKCYQYVIN